MSNKITNIPPRTENIVTRKFYKIIFFEITIGIIITSGGIGKKELSIKETEISNI